MTPQIPASRERKDCRAFALIEAMIILAIVGLFAAMAIPAWIKVRHRHDEREFVGPILEKNHFAAYTASVGRLPLATLIIPHVVPHGRTGFTVRPIIVPTHTRVHHPERWEIVMAGKSQDGAWQIIHFDLTEREWNAVEVGQTMKRKALP